jgi:ribosomal protein S18 acetylase RimI-like enzyme
LFFVRTASEQDLNKVRDLLGKTWHALYDAEYGVESVAEFHEQRHSLAYLKTYLRRPDSEFLVADDGRRFGGMAYAAMSQQLAKTVELYMLYVDPEEQRQGIGRDLFAELETCFPAAEIMRLEVAQDNPAAIAFYTAHGFTEAGRIENGGEGQPGLPALILEKPLASH